MILYLPETYVDKDKLEKIVGNLLSNAFKFTPSGGSILVNLSQVEEIEEGKNKSAGFFKIEVKDTGVGIKKEERIFDRFFQEDSSYTDLILPLKENKPDILNYQSATFTAALNWNALPGYLNLSGGLFYSNVFGFRLPLGVSLGIFDNAMFSISTADLLLCGITETLMPDSLLLPLITIFNF